MLYCSAATNQREESTEEARDFEERKTMKQEVTPVRVVLVTGSSGFLGQHVVKELQEEEHSTITEIRLFDNRPYVKRIGKAHFTA
ncbi:hypothetical protein MTO96_034245 [Rhipicephalus appendiculatus]